MLYSKTLLFIFSLHNSLYLLIPNSHSSLLPAPLPLGNYQCIYPLCLHGTLSPLRSILPTGYSMLTYSLCVALCTYAWA